MARYHIVLVLASLGLEVIYGENLDALKAEESALPNLAKEVEDNSRYKILEANATVVKLLVDDKDGVSRSEVFDMLHSKDDNEEHMDLPTFPEDAEDSKADVPALPDAQAEFLQAADDVVSKDATRRSGPRGEPAGAAAGIMVVITCSIVCVAYTALIVWRRIYLKRNGLKHELLRNEEVIAETRIEIIIANNNSTPSNCECEDHTYYIINNWDHQTCYSIGKKNLQSRPLEPDLSNDLGACEDIYVEETKLKVFLHIHSLQYD